MRGLRRPAITRPGRRKAEAQAAIVRGPNCPNSILKYLAYKSRPRTHVLKYIIWAFGRPGMNKGRLTSLVRLSYLGPEIVRALLAGSQSNALTPSRLLRLSKNLPHDWKEQRCFLGFAA